MEKSMQETLAGVSVISFIWSCVSDSGIFACTGFMWICEVFMDRGFDLYWKPEHLGLVILVGFDSVIQDSVVLHPGSCSHALKFAVLGTHGLNGLKLGKASILFLLLHQNSSDTSRAGNPMSSLRKNCLWFHLTLYFHPQPVQWSCLLPPVPGWWMGGAHQGQWAGSLWSWEVQSVSLLNAAFTLQPLTWAPVIYYRGSVLITYLQYLTLAPEISFSLAIRGWEKRSLQNPKCEPREKGWGARGCFSKLSL